MAGSCVEVLLSAVPSDSQRAKVNQLVAIAASEVEGSSFWVAGQPYSMYEGEPDDEFSQLNFGWSPQYTIGLCAGCRGSAGDFFLAMLAIRVAELLNGFIAFGGGLELFTSDPGLLTLEGRFTSLAAGDVLTPQFMKAWVAHPHFEMVN